MHSIVFLCILCNHICTLLYPLAFFASPCTLLNSFAFFATTYALYCNPLHSLHPLAFYCIPLHSLHPLAIYCIPLQSLHSLALYCIPLHFFVSPCTLLCSIFIISNHLHSIVSLFIFYITLYLLAFYPSLTFLIFPCIILQSLASLCFPLHSLAFPCKFLHSLQLLYLFNPFTPLQPYPTPLTSWTP